MHKGHVLFVVAARYPWCEYRSPLLAVPGEYTSVLQHDDLGVRISLLAKHPVRRVHERRVSIFSERRGLGGFQPLLNGEVGRMRPAALFPVVDDCLKRLGNHIGHRLAANLRFPSGRIRCFLSVCFFGGGCLLLLLELPFTNKFRVIHEIIPFSRRQKSPAEQLTGLRWPCARTVRRIFLLYHNL